MKYMNTLSLNSLWAYLQSLELTTSNKKWLADHLYEAIKGESLSADKLSQQPSSLNKAYIENGEVKIDIATETMSIEEARALTLKAVELEYSLP